MDMPQLFAINSTAFTGAMDSKSQHNFANRFAAARSKKPMSQLLTMQILEPGALPKALLTRARNIASEHDALRASLTDSFDPKTAKRAGELSNVADALKQWEAARASLVELQGLLESDDPEMRELALDDVASTNEQLDRSGQNLSVALTPKHPFADMPCLIEIRPGPGGLEGRLFADSLFQMYEKYFSNKGYRFRVVKHEASDAAGDYSGGNGEIALQEAVLEVLEPGAYNMFRGEAGMHRVQRVPVTEKSGRVHTSAVAVWVLPSFPEGGTGTEADFEDPESDFFIDPNEVRTEVMRARGAGGQHVNKTESAIRLTHVPTGTTVSMQDSRSQQRNRDYAWRVLRSRIAQQRREAREEAARKLKNSVLSKAQVTRGDKIRTYNYNQNRCTDHRCNLDIYNLPDIMEGGDSLDRVFDSVRAWYTEKDIEAVIAEEEATALAQEKGSGPK